MIKETIRVPGNNYLDSKIFAQAVIPESIKKRIPTLGGQDKIHTHPFFTEDFLRSQYMQYLNESLVQVAIVEKNPDRAKRISDDIHETIKEGQQELSSEICQQILNIGELVIKDRGPSANERQKISQHIESLFKQIFRDIK